MDVTHISQSVLHMVVVLELNNGESNHVGVAFAEYLLRRDVCPLHNLHCVAVIEFVLPHVIVLSLTTVGHWVIVHASVLHGGL